MGINNEGCNIAGCVNVRVRGYGMMPANSPCGHLSLRPPHCPLSADRWPRDLLRSPLVTHATHEFTCLWYRTAKKVLLSLILSGLWWLCSTKSTLLWQIARRSEHSSLDKVNPRFWPSRAQQAQDSTPSLNLFTSLDNMWIRELRLLGRDFRGSMAYKTGFNSAIFSDFFCFVLKYCNPGSKSKKVKPRISEYSYIRSTSGLVGASSF